MADEITSSSSPGYRSGCHAISRFGHHLGLTAWHILPQSHVFSFAHLDLVFILWHSFTTDETVASLCLQLVCLSFFLTVFN